MGYPKAVTTKKNSQSFYMHCKKIRENSLNLFATCTCKIRFVSYKLYGVLIQLEIISMFFSSSINAIKYIGNFVVVVLLFCFMNWA